MKKRLAVYCFYDRDGIVDDYVIYFLNELRKAVSWICCVVNGKLNDNGRKSLQEYADEVIERANEGLDAGAFAFVVKSRYEEIRKYDELILCNNSFFGPLYPLSDVFSEMYGRPEKYDFWGMTIHPRAEGVIHKSQKLPYVNSHVQSYFIVFTQKVINSDVFINFFRSLPEIHEFYEAVCLYELELTHVLSEAGFSYGSLVDSKDLPQANSTILYPDILIREKKFPFIKRKVFIEDYSVFFDIGRSRNAERCLDYVREQTSYDEGLIWQHIIRTEKMSELRQNLNLCFTAGSSPAPRLQNQDINAAAVCCIDSPSDISECVSFMGNAFGVADLYFVSGRKETLDSVRKCAEVASLTPSKFILKPDKGGDLSAWLITCAPLFDSYDYLCFVHGERDLHLDDRQLTHDCFRMCIEGMLSSKAYIAGVLNIFASHPRLGLAVMPPLNFGPFYKRDFVISPGTKDYLLHLMRVLQLDVPFDEMPVVPCCGMFWCRTAALKKLLSLHWSYDDLPEEPLPPDGTIAHALDRIPQFAAQSAGYYSAWIQPESAVTAYQNNLCYINRKLNERLFGVYGVSGLKQILQSIGRMSKDFDRVKKAASGKISGAWNAFRFRRRHSAIKRLIDKERDQFLEFFAGRKDLWDPEYFLKENTDIVENGTSPLEYYIDSGWKEGLSPSGSLLTDAYLRVNPDCRQLDVSPLEHYYIFSRKRKLFLSYMKLRACMIGQGTEILKRSSKFDPDFYTKCCRNRHGYLPDGFDPYAYYLEHGAKETVSPCSGFGVHRYLDRFPDLRTYGICPVVHYELIGRYL